MKIGYELRKSLGMQFLLDEMAPSTPYGAEHVRQPHFYGPGERHALEQEWANVRAAVEGLAETPEAYDRISHLMMQVRDIRGTLKRCEEMVLTEVELFEVKRFLLQLGLIAPLYKEVGAPYHGIAFTQEAEALRLLDPDGQRTAGFAVSSAYTKTLAHLREEKRQLELTLRNTPEGSTRETLLHKRRQLIAREAEEELQVRARLTEALRPHIPALRRNVQALGKLDYTLQKAALAKRWDASMPVVAPSDDLTFDAMQNPQLAASLSEREQRFTPISIACPQGVTVITGANMGGKSVAIRTLALNVLLCQSGFFACAARAELPLFDAVHVIGGDLTDMAAGLSSFGAEVTRIQSVLDRVQAGENSLVMLDEPARGTNPSEGAALVQALVRRFAGLGATTVIATHFDGMALEAQAHYQAAGLRDVEDTPPSGDRLAYIAAHMNYGLMRVQNETKTPREALTVCRLLGLDEAIVSDMADRLSTPHKCRKPVENDQ